mmetsp:Transcript_9640/g.25738  ORF Transcript_9640/g.25738 Transcript_9640/m.25738 type:complete len:598 (-) Transcript_9640:453-2246(-)
MRGGAGRGEGEAMVMRGDRVRRHGVLLVLAGACAALAAAQDAESSDFTLSVGGETIGQLGVNPKVIESKKLVGKWATCDPSKNGNVFKAGEDSCPELDKYGFRAVFSFFYDGLPLYVGDPVVVVSNSKVSAEIEYFENDQIEQSGDFSIVFDCSDAPDQSTYVTVVVEDLDWGSEPEGDDYELDDGREGSGASAETEPAGGGRGGEANGADSDNFLAVSFSFSFVKHCGSGGLSEISVMAAGEDSAAELRPVQDLVVPESTKVSRFLLTIEEPLRYLIVRPPSVKVGPDVQVSLRGMLAFGGAVESWDKADLVVLYECMKENSAIPIEISIPLPPFSPKVIKFTKKCGASGMFDSEEGFIGDEESAAEPNKDSVSASDSSSEQADLTRQRTMVPMFQRLRIGTDGFYDANVWSDGQAGTRFKLTSADMQSAAIPGDLMMFSPVQSSLSLYIWNSDDEQRLGYDLLEVTSSSPKTLRAFVEPSSGGGLMSSSTVGPYNVDIGADDKMAAIRMVCRAKGVSKVLVTMLLKTGRQVEFGFAKTCEAPRKMQKRGFMRTAGSLLTVIGMLFFTVGSYMLYRYGTQARQAFRDYSRVRASQD